MANVAYRRVCRKKSKDKLNSQMIWYGLDFATFYLPLSWQGFIRSILSDWLDTDNSSFMFYKCPINQKQYSISRVSSGSMFSEMYIMYTSIDSVMVPVCSFAFCVDPNFRSMYWKCRIEIFSSTYSFSSYRYPNFYLNLDTEKIINALVPPDLIPYNVYIAIKKTWEIARIDFMCDLFWSFSDHLVKNSNHWTTILNRSKKKEDQETYYFGRTDSKNKNRLFRIYNKTLDDEKKWKNHISNYRHSMDLGATVRTRIECEYRIDRLRRIVSGDHHISAMVFDLPEDFLSIIAQDFFFYSFWIGKKVVVWRAPDRGNDDEEWIKKAERLLYMRSNFRWDHRYKLALWMIRSLGNSYSSTLEILHDMESFYLSQNQI